MRTPSGARRRPAVRHRPSTRVLPRIGCGVVGVRNRRASARRRRRTVRARRVRSPCSGCTPCVAARARRTGWSRPGSAGRPPAGRRRCAPRCPAACRARARSAGPRWSAQVIGSSSTRRRIVVPSGTGRIVWPVVAKPWAGLGVADRPGLVEAVEQRRRPVRGLALLEGGADAEEPVRQGEQRLGLLDVVGVVGALDEPPRVRRVVAGRRDDPPRRRQQPVVAGPGVVRAPHWARRATRRGRGPRRRRRAPPGRRPGRRGPRRSPARSGRRGPRRPRPARLRRRPPARG